MLSDIACCCQPSCCPGINDFRHRRPSGRFLLLLQSLFIPSFCPCLPIWNYFLALFFHVKLGKWWYNTITKGNNGAEYILFARQSDPKLSNDHSYLLTILQKFSFLHCSFIVMLGQWWYKHIITRWQWCWIYTIYTPVWWSLSLSDCGCLLTIRHRLFSHFVLSRQAWEMMIQTYYLKLAAVLNVYYLHVSLIPTLKDCGFLKHITKIEAFCSFLSKGGFFIFLSFVYQEYLCFFFVNPCPFLYCSILVINWHFRWGMWRKWLVLKIFYNESLYEGNKMKSVP